MQDVCCMTKVAIDALVETKHYYTYPDEKRKRFGKISDKFPNLDKILQKQDFLQQNHFLHHQSFEMLVEACRVDARRLLHDESRNRRPSGN